MNTPIIIRNKVFKFKKNALLYFKEMLNRYDFGDCLTLEDKLDVISLVEENGERLEKTKQGVRDIEILKVQYGNKCFMLVFKNNTNKIFSYVHCINGKLNPRSKFTAVCRNAIQSDLQNIKQQYFDVHSKKGKVKCQETGHLSSWTELNVDHRQPNTFSIIVDRFIELHAIDVEKVTYIKN
jgi:hypothetical protein